MLTIQQAQQYLSSIGLAPPEPIIMAWLDMFNDLQDCLDGAGYSGATQSLILSYLIGLYGLSGGNMYISSQSAPSGASRSFRFAELRNAWKGHLNMLRMLDTAAAPIHLFQQRPIRKVRRLLSLRAVVNSLIVRGSK